MGLKNFFFETVETKDTPPSPTPQPAQGGAGGNITFSRRLPSLSDNKAAASPTASFNDTLNSLLPSVTKKAPASGIDKSKFHDHFDQVLANAGAPTPNYFTFSQMLAEMGEELPDAPKYKGAFGALRAQGLSKQALLNSANAYITLLDQDNSAFKAEALGSQKESQDQIQGVNNLVASNNIAMEKVKNEVAQQIQQLEQARDIKLRQLQKEIDDNKAKIAPLEEAASKINSRIDAFKEACDDYKAMIASDIQKIQMLIPEKQ